ncbi:MAG: efflux RND transporter periplasmic adaptor subunit [Thiohalobacterales bacterium]|nr:efflux RND transporter periplasmic adaptor subunit [Thiohalobacterales bacterium]
MAAQPAALAGAPVEYVTVTQEEIFNGVIEAVHESTVAAQTAGRVTEVLFDVDDHVPRDSVIIRLRDTEQRAGLKEAEARHVQARNDYQREQKLFAQDAGSKSALEKAEAALKTAAAALEAAREQTEHTVIRAPYGGIVVERLVEPGESVQPGTPLMTGLSLEQLRITTDIPERLIQTVRTWHRARVLLPGDPQEAIQVDDITVSPRADRTTHTFEVRVPLTTTREGLYPGMSVKVAITTGQANRLLIPAGAIVRRSEVTGVYVLQDEGVVFRQIRAGREHGDAGVEVLAGLSAGEQVALDPVQAAIMLKSLRAGPGDE